METWKLVKIWFNKISEMKYVNVSRVTMSMGVRRGLRKNVIFTSYTKLWLTFIRLLPPRPIVNPTDCMWNLNKHWLNLFLKKHGQMTTPATKKEFLRSSQKILNQNDRDNLYVVTRQGFLAMHKSFSKQCIYYTLKNEMKRKIPLWVGIHNFLQSNYRCNISLFNYALKTKPLL